MEAEEESSEEDPAEASTENDFESQSVSLVSCLLHSCSYSATHDLDGQDIPSRDV